MSDPYLDFDNDLSDIQVNVFHVTGPLRGLTSQKDKEKFLHRDVTIFNPTDSSKPSIEGQKMKSVKEKIYLTDTIEILMNKIARYCCDDISGKEIFAWLDHNPKKETSLRYSYPLGIHYSELGDFINPYIEKNYDERFCSSDGSVKRDPKFSTDYYSSYQKYRSLFRDIKLVRGSTNIYFCTLQDILEYLPSSPLKEIENQDILLNGYLKKYFPKIDKIDSSYDDYRDKSNQKLDLLSHFKGLQEHIYPYEMIDCRPVTLVYQNRIEKNSIDLFKIFKEFEVKKDVPYLKIYIDSYLDSCMKLDKDSIYSDTIHDKSRTVTKDIFEKWNRNISLHNGFTIPGFVDKTNTLSFVLYDTSTTNYAQMILYSDGKVELYIEKLMRIEQFNDKISKSFIGKCNTVIIQLNKKNYSETGILIPTLNKYPIRIDCSYLYDIPDYNPSMLLKPFKNFYNDFIVIEELPEEPLHLLYTKSSGYYDPKKIYSFISLLRKKKLEDEKIVSLLSQRYHMKKSDAQEELTNWMNVYQGRFSSKDLKDAGTSVIIEKVLDRIKVSLVNLSGLEELHECMNTINFLLGVYRSKKIDKNKDFPDEISSLFKKVNKKFKDVAIVREEVPEPVKETVQAVTPSTDEVIDEDEEESDEEESDEEDDYGRISSSNESIDSQSGGGSDKKGGLNKKGGGSDDEEDEDESKYPNKRYYVKRLEQRDPKLIKFKGKTSKDGYAYKCQASSDKQPIVLTKDELDEIDHKTGFKNEGVSYSKAVRIEGGDRPELYYICPKFWDRKHQIPLDPLNKIHPIEKVDYEQFVYRKEMKDNDCFILERTGRPSGRSDHDSFWNKNQKDKDNIMKYNVQFIHDDVHPDLLALPCCGKKPVTFALNSFVNVLLFDDGKSSWGTGQIKGKCNKDDEYPVSINDQKSVNIHVSLLKPFKGSNDRLSTDFPLRLNSNGHIHPLLKDLFHVRKEDPILTKSSNNGFYRKGIHQGADAFLNCLDMIHRENKSNPKIKRDRLDLGLLKENILHDMKSIDLFSIGGGSFVQYFRDEKISLSDNILDKIKASVMKNFKDYLDSDEPKDDRILTSLIHSICRLDRNRTFEGYQFNLVVFNEKNETVRINEPIGKFNFIDGSPFAFIYKDDYIYEPLIYHYKDKNYGYVNYDSDEKIAKGDDIIFDDTIAKIITNKKDGYKIQVKDTNEILEIEKTNLRKYDMKNVLDIVTTFIDREQSKQLSKSKEYLTEEDLYTIIEKMNLISLNKGYYDTYNRLSMIEFRVKHDRGFKRMVLPIKPKSISEKTATTKTDPISELPKYELSKVIELLKEADKVIQDDFGDKYSPYLDGKEQILVNHKEMGTGLLLSRGIIIPLTKQKYHYQNYKINISITVGLLDTQDDYLLGEYLEDELTEYFDEYNEKMQKSYGMFSEAYVTIMKKKILFDETNKIISHPVKLMIHKRWYLFDLFSEEDDIKLKDTDLKKFIEFILIHGLEEVNKMFIHTFISLKDIKLRNISEKIIILSMKDIKNGLHETYFESKSQYIRDISYYDEYNPNIQRKLLKRELTIKHVSFETKYPHLLKKLFNGKIRVLKNIISDENTDITILSDLLLTMNTSYNQEFIHETLKELLKPEKSYVYENLLLGEHYKNNKELLEDLEDPDYYLTSYDLKMLSLKCEVGFLLYTNRYLDRDKKFETQIIFHEDLRKTTPDKFKLPMVCFYQDFSDEKTIKPIEVNEQITLDFQELYKNTQFKNILKKTYRI